ncbi:unnamed protein product [Mytilus edulis]|uniref:Uncharacterized protein n=1 Tax=Mytilus edulis TaxID=6550 RepID=A0A8S3Q2C4_MYTED|nr:unnamed protein product [Mytilus edulis]
MLVTAVSADDTNNIKLPLWGTHTDKLKTVWKELDPDEHEEECVIPSTWVNQETRKVRWPKGINTIRAMNKLRRPEEKWNTFDLVKVKVSSGRFKICEEFDFTTSAEITDEEKNSQQGDLHVEGKRISKKKTYPEFDTEESSTRDEILGYENTPFEINCSGVERAEQQLNNIFKTLTMRSCKIIKSFRKKKLKKAMGR